MILTMIIAVYILSTIWYWFVCKKLYEVCWRYSDPELIDVIYMFIPIFNAFVAFLFTIEFFKKVKIESKLCKKFFRIRT